MPRDENRRGFFAASSMRMAGGSSRLMARAQIISRDGIDRVNAAIWAQRVNAGVRASGAGDMHGLPSIPPTISLENALDGGRPGCTCQPWNSVPS